MFNKKSTLLNRKGFSIAEVLVSAGLLAIVGLGAASLFQNVGKEQAQNNLLVNLRDLKIKFTNNIQDPKAWNNTIHVAANGFNCLISDPPTACTAVSSASPNALVELRDASNNVFYSGANWSSPTTALNGFTATGAPCTGFSAVAGAGNDACPVAFRMAWEPICPASGSCKTPAIKVTIRAIYNPSAGAASSKLVNTIANSDVNTATAPGKYDFQLVRASSGISKAFTLTHRDSAGPAGGGTCGSARPYTEDTDPYDLVSISGTTFTLVAGNYNCSLNALGFSSGGFTARVLNTTAGSTVATSNNVSPRWTQTPVNFNFNINIAANANFQVDQTCEYTPGGTPNADQYALGLSGPTYSFGPTGQTFSTLSCTSVN